MFVLAHPPMWWADDDGVHRHPGWDLTRVFLADLAHMRRALADGELPWWNPWDRTGYSFVAEPQSGMFDITTWLVVALGLGMGAMPGLLAVVKAVLHYAIAGAGMATLLGSQRSPTRLPTWAVAFGTAAFVLAPRLDKLKDQSALWPTAWVGWLLVAIDAVVRRPTPWRGMWLGAASGVIVCAGYPPGAFRMGLLAVPWLVLGVWRQVRGDAAADRRGYARALAIALGIAALVAAALSAGQIVATLSSLPATTRAGLETGDIVASRTVLAHAWGLFAPLDSTAALLTYSGIATAAGVVLALVLGRRAEVWMIAIVAIVGFLLACGEHGPLLPALASVPGFAAFRIAGHYLTLTAVAVPILGAIGLALLAETSGRMRWVGVAIATIGLGIYLGRAHEPSTLAIVAAITSAVLVAALGLVPAIHRSKVGWALVAVLAIDLYAAGRRVADILVPLPDPHRADPMLALHAEITDDPLAYRVADFGWVGDRMGPRTGRRDLVGHRPALTDTAYLGVYHVAIDGALLRQFNVAVAGFERRPRNAVARRHLRRRPEHPLLFAVNDPWPLAFATDTVTVAADPVAARDWLVARGEPGAVIEADELPRDLELPVDTGASWPASRVTMHTNDVEIEIDVPTTAMLVVAEAWAPDWHATIDGEDAPVLRVNLLQRGVMLPAGPHVVRLEYRPRAVIALWWLWALGTVGLVGAAIVHARRQSGRRTTNTSR